MRAVAAVAAGLLSTGCFYVDPIVPRPEVHIDKQGADDILRNGPLVLEARFTNRTDEDPELGKYDWQLLACAAYNGHDADDCDEEPFGTPSGPLFSAHVPVRTTKAAKLIKAIFVKLEAKDGRGALATEAESYPVGNAPPTLRIDAAHGVPVGGPLDVFVTYGDPDDDVTMLEPPQIQVIPPRPSASYTLEPLPERDPSPLARIMGNRLTPEETGAWRVTYTVRDPAGAATPASLDFTVNPDRAPCLDQWQPIVAPRDATLPITGPTVFQVPLVDDDLDAYPPRTDAQQYGTTTFVWSILRPGASSRQILVGATGNRFDLDPGAFAPGSVVEIRVEIFDRQRTALPCADEDASCSLRSGCPQRQTWRVEVR